MARKRKKIPLYKSGDRYKIIVIKGSGKVKKGNIVKYEDTLKNTKDSVNEANKYYREVGKSIKVSYIKLKSPKPSTKLSKFYRRKGSYAN